MNLDAADLHTDDLDVKRSKWDTREPLSSFPTLEEVMSFSVESIWYERPLGYYQMAHWHWDRRKYINS